MRSQCVQCAWLSRWFETNRSCTLHTFSSVQTNHRISYSNCKILRWEFHHRCCTYEVEINRRVLWYIFIVKTAGSNGRAELDKSEVVCFEIIRCIWEKYTLLHGNRPHIHGLGFFIEIFETHSNVRHGHNSYVSSQFSSFLCCLWQTCENNNSSNKHNERPIRTILWTRAEFRCLQRIRSVFACFAWSAGWLVHFVWLSDFRSSLCKCAF